LIIACGDGLAGPARVRILVEKTTLSRIDAGQRPADYDESLHPNLLDCLLLEWD